MAKNTDPLRSDRNGAIYPAQRFWPAYRFHPDIVIKDDGTFDPKMGRVFESPDMVPEGWTETPGKPEPVAGPSAAALENIELRAKLAALEAAGPAPLPTKKLGKKAAEARAAKIAGLAAVGYASLDLENATDAQLDELVAAEAAEAAEEA